jgi:hypothetical protein
MFLRLTTLCVHSVWNVKRLFCRLLARCFHTMWSCVKQFCLSTPQKRLAFSVDFVVDERFTRGPGNEQNRTSSSGKPSSQHEIGDVRSRWLK